MSTITRRRVLILKAALIAFAAQAAAVRAQDDGGGDWGGDWGDDWGDDGDWGGDDGGWDGGWDHGHEGDWSGSDYSDPPSLMDLALDVLQEIATGSGYSGDEDESDDGLGEGTGGSFVDRAIDVLASAFDVSVSSFEEMVEALADSLYACVDASAEGGTVGYCVAGNGNVYGTVGVSVGSPLGFQIGAATSADGYLNGGSFSANLGIGVAPGIGFGGGVTPDGQNWAGSIGTLGAGYSEGKMVGNVFSELGRAWSNDDDEPGQLSSGSRAPDGGRENWNH